MTIASVNPATGETLATFTPQDDAEVELAAAAAAVAGAGRRSPSGPRSSPGPRSCSTNGVRPSPGSPPWKWARRSPPPGPRWRSAPGSAVTTPRRRRGCSPPRRWRPTPAVRSSVSTRSGWCSRSCPGTSPTGRSSASPPRRSRQRRYTSSPQCARDRGDGAMPGLRRAGALHGARVAPLCRPAPAASSPAQSRPNRVAAGREPQEDVLASRGDPFLVLPSAADRAVATAVTAGCSTTASRASPPSGS